MKRIGRRGRLWLRGFHIFFMGALIGSQISGMLIILLAGNATDGSELHTYYTSAILMDFVVIPSIFGTLITGVLLCWQTHWGFFKYKWVIYSEVGYYPVFTNWSNLA